MGAWRAPSQGAAAAARVREVCAHFGEVCTRRGAAQTAVYSTQRARGGSCTRAQRSETAVSALPTAVSLALTGVSERANERFSAAAWVPGG